MKKITLLLAGMLLFPCLASAQSAQNPMNDKTGQVFEQNAKEKAALANLSKAGKALQAKFQLFRKDALNIMTNTQIDNEKRFDFVAQSLLSSVIDPLKAFDANHAKEMKALEGLNKQSVACAAKYSSERRALLKEVAKPIEGKDWYAFVKLNGEDNDQIYALVSDFIEKDLPAALKN